MEGFRKTIEAAGGAEIVSTLEVTVSDLTTGKLVPAKIQAELLKHPEATWIKSPYTYVTTLGVAAALGANANKVKVMGGEGFADELDLIRSGKITAANIISSEWTGWGAIDTMNSFFLGQEPADSGIGWTIADATHNLPASGEFVKPVDFQAEYKAGAYEPRRGAGEGGRAAQSGPQRLGAGAQIATSRRRSRARSPCATSRST